jgi:general secretion pathway protein J
LKHSASAGPSRADARAGFALLEMLAALAIAVAMLGVLAQFTSLTMRNWNRGESTIAAMEMLTTGLARLRADLAMAIPMRPPGTDSTNVVFVGGADSLLFVAATGFGAGDRGVELLAINVTKNDDGIALVRQRGQVTSGQTPLRDPVVLLRGRMQVQFSYYDNDGQTLPTWSQRDQLPKAVGINVLNAAGVAVFPVPLMMKLPTNLAAGCAGGAGGDGTTECPGPRQQRPPQESQTDQ